MTRPTTQRCSKCGEAFLGSDYITIPAVCPRCSHVAQPQIDERTQIYSMAIRKCAKKCSEYEDYHWKLYQANPNSPKALDHQTRANAAANCESAILALLDDAL